MDKSALFLLVLSIVIFIVSVLGINVYQKCCVTKEQKDKTLINIILLSLILILSLVGIVFGSIFLYYGIKVEIPTKLPTVSFK